MIESCSEMSILWRVLYVFGHENQIDKTLEQLPTTNTRISVHETWV